MPKKIKTEASVAQNRESQRRSRARRREFVQSLQQRLTDMERRGIEATLEMQQAALGVANENRLLRLLLSRHGISENEISGFIASSGLQTAAPLPSPSLHGNTNMYGNSSSTGHPAEICKNSINCMEEGSCLCPSADALSTTHTMPCIPPSAVSQTSGTQPGSVPLPLLPAGTIVDSLITPTTITSADTQVPRQNHHGQDHMKTMICNLGRTQEQGEFADPQDILPQGSHNVHSPYSHTGTANEGRSAEAGPMEISCEEAAVIIASIRSDVEAAESIKQIRLELGCNDTNHCLVKNIKVFQLIDASH